MKKFVCSVSLDGVENRPDTKKRGKTMASNARSPKIWSLIKDIKRGMLTTRQGDELRAWPLLLVQDDYKGTLWFYTDLLWGEVFELKTDNTVSVSFADADNQTYVWLTGVGKSVQDKTLVDRYWNAAVSAWFPGGKDSPNVGLLEIKVKKTSTWQGPN